MKLAVEHLNFAYEKKETVLKDLCFSAEGEQAIGIIGANGAGKSTLLNLIDGIYRCDSGCVEINGENRSIEKFYEVFGNSDVLLRASCGVNLGGLGVALDYKLPWSTLQKYFQDKEDTIETVKKGRVSLALLFNLF